MATFTIVAAHTDPLGPNEIAAGDPITVTDGDIFIVDPSADANITFESDGGGPADFDIVFGGSNTNGFNITVLDDLTPSIDVPDNANLIDINLQAQSADGVQFTAGNNASFGQFVGSHDGPNIAVIGDGFTTDDNWKFGDNDDTLIVGDDATFKNIDTEDGDDTIVFGDRATTENVHMKEGDDSFTAGDDFNGGNIDTDKGNDSIRTGENAQANEFDGGEGNDTHTTETQNTNDKEIESRTVVCFAPDTMIDTPDGRRAVQFLRPGDMVITVNRGPQPIRWVRKFDRSYDTRCVDDMPVLIRAGALGIGRPAQDLIVSPQHRILVGGGGQLIRTFGKRAFVPAKALTGLPGIRHMRGKTKSTWIHFACDHHEVVTANGCLSETLLLGAMVLDSLTESEQRSLFNVFGSSAQPGQALNGPPAHPVLKVGDARRQIMMHLPDRSFDRVSQSSGRTFAVTPLRPAIQLEHAAAG